MTIRPSQAYDAGVAAGEWQADPAQQKVLPTLDRIAREMADAPSGFVATLKRALGRAAAVRGLYLHGSVGRGKTFLIDLLHEHLADESLGARWHFHRFMGHVHAELAKLPGQEDPLRLVAREVATKPLLCLDEFFVQDIADAMILAKFLEHFGEAGGTLVTTSNIAPRELYREGLQRAKFLPAIAWLERHCEVICLDSPTDYRLRALTQAPVYVVPPGADADAALERMFRKVAPGSCTAGGELVVNDRPIPVRQRADGVAWFDFAALCDGPRSVADYIELAKSFNTLLVSGVPVFDRLREDAGRRFVHLVDELYDRNVNLVVSAEAMPTALYAGDRLQLEFERTASRLIEMQSTDYLGREHLA